MGRVMSDEFLHLDTFSTLDDARRWRNRAEEMRVLSEGMMSEYNKVVAQRLASSYERLASLAEQRAESNERVGSAADDPSSNLQDFLF
jgi:hypothetical protein